MLLISTISTITRYVMRVSPVSSSTKRAWQFVRSERMGVSPDGTSE